MKRNLVFIGGSADTTTQAIEIELEGGISASPEFYTGMTEDEILNWMPKKHQARFEPAFSGDIDQKIVGVDGDSFLLENGGTYTPKYSSLIGDPVAVGRVLRVFQSKMTGMTVEQVI